MSGNQTSDVVFTAANMHSADCGRAPGIRNLDPGRHYYGYFENQYGEQWVFMYDKEEESATLRGGDASWDTAYPIRDGKAEGLRLADTEIRWLRLCWEAATMRFPPRTGQE